MMRNLILTAAICATPSLALAESPTMEDLMKQAKQAQIDLDEMADARQLSQALAISEQCGINLDLSAVTEISAKFSSSGNATARMTFESSGRAQKFRFKTMSDVEKAQACGSARAAIEKYDLAAKE